MGCPVGTVRSRLHRARGLLAAKLKRQLGVREMAVR
jgi:DNA-directed RNA polymerase specialized sigma24 family protein